MNTNLPNVISASVLRELADPAETQAVRVILLTSLSSTQATVRGSRRKYIMSFCGETGRHILDVPASLWERGIPLSRYSQNDSIAHDIQSKPNILFPIVTKIVPWGNAVVATAAATPPATLQDAGDDSATQYDLLKRYLREAQAPKKVMDAIDVLETSKEDFIKIIEAVSSQEAESPSEPEAALPVRARKTSKA
jgi:hypothetical protein